MILRIPGPLLLFLSMILGPFGAAHAAENDFYQGKTLTIIVSTDAGTGYDIYARTIARGMEREENDGSAATFYSTLKVNKPDWLAQKKVIPLLQYGGAPDPELPNVPFVMSLLENASDRELMEIASAPLAVGRPLVAPLGVDPDRIELLRSSLAQTFKDPGYLADCAKQLIACDTPLSGKEIDAILQHAYEAKPSVRDRLVSIYESRD
jgi:hypothetical protein